MAVEPDEVVTKQLSLQDITGILRADKIDELVNVEETAYFECREFSYTTFLDDKAGADRNKFNLVKDIVSIANSGGGIICIGLKTKLKTNEKTEYITEIKPVPSDHIRVQDWEDILAAYTIPIFKREWIEWVYSGDNKKIFWIKIADIRQSPDYPVLVTLAKEIEKGLSTTRETVGLYTRDRSVNVPYSPERIQAFIRQGLLGNDDDSQFKYFKTMLENIDAKIDKLIKENTEEDFAKYQIDLVDEYVSLATHKLDHAKGLFFMLATPTSKKISIDNFWEQNDKSIYNFLKNTPHLRRHGWDLSVAMSEYPYPEGKSWEVMNGNRKIAKCDIFGRFFAAGSIDEFLDWGVEDYHKNDKDTNFINAFALVEYIDTFFHSLEVLKTNYDIVSDYVVTAGFVKVGANAKLLFPPHIVGIFDSKSQNIKLTTWQVKVSPEISSDPARIAGKLVQEMYVSGFGIAPDMDYPYLIKDDLGYRVDELLYIKKG